MIFRQLTFAAATALLFSLPAVAQDKLKIATVDMQTLFKQYHRTNAAQKEVNVERAKIQQQISVFETFGTRSSDHPCATPSARIVR